MILNLQNKSGTLEGFIDLECFSFSGALTLCGLHSLSSVSYTPRNNDPESLT